MGKVHGSLSRAGKVRNATPKVEPTEKKKKKTGRCALRLKFTKRFQAQQAQGRGRGRKRGPNSQEGK